MRSRLKVARGGRWPSKLGVVLFVFIILACVALRLVILGVDVINLIFGGSVSLIPRINFLLGGFGALTKRFLPSAALCVAAARPGRILLAGVHSHEADDVNVDDSVCVLAEMMIRGLIEEGIERTREWEERNTEAAGRCCCQLFSSAKAEN